MAPQRSRPSVRDRLRARLRHYLAYTALFLLLYGGLRLWLGRFPEPLLFGVLAVSLAKDLYDEFRLRRGGTPLAFAGFEHAPSNAVVLAFLALGVMSPAGTVGGVPSAYVAGGLAALDLLFDLHQDLRSLQPR